MTSNTSAQSRPIRHVGYIGLGIMGQGMARNLLKAGYQLTVWNRTKSKCESLVEAGAALADSPSAMAQAAGHAAVDAILINVTDTPDVEAVLFGQQGVAAGAAKRTAEAGGEEGLIVVDHSTISPQATQQFAQRLAEQGVSLLDAPVSGGDVGARNGTLSIMVGGCEQAFTRCRPVFEAMGRSVVHLGPSGMGQTCKACNQVAVVGTLMAVCEALALARKSGLDLERMIEVVSGGAGGSWQLTNLGPRIAGGDHDPGFMIDLVLKDLAIVLQSAADQQLPLSFTALANNYFRAAAASGAGRLGTQAVARVLEQLGQFKYDQPAKHDQPAIGIPPKPAD